VISRPLTGWLWRSTIVLATLVSLASLTWTRHQRALEPWEKPRWEPSQFTEIVASPETNHDGETWVVPVNLGCGSCFRRIERLVADAAPETRVAVAALIVDTPSRPLADLLEHRGVRRVYWDEHQVWRRRWGHALYGEVLVFGRDGSLRITVPPGMNPTAPRFAAHAPGKTPR
jgi:hypothetical protein